MFWTVVLVIFLIVVFWAAVIFGGCKLAERIGLYDVQEGKGN